ncbi:hypothetical protein RDI58_016559 [Solanum bulbocastanum]|uniref:Uncharacterized protein n=1 Tax=Solanum bulbocastanum TaxID=147425 RepID=A0AAN8YCK5_SOLBU
MTNFFKTLTCLLRRRRGKRCSRSLFWIKRLGLAN